ncbi:MAG: carboxypeptidase regulatory-like domain-containing protein, partial [Candidatus Cloacimonetes bacterium]|nr:carboxypeptidase regulatory-like domain-containing protein [Candidatus Cloacimonadota bacterium]
MKRFFCCLALVTLIALPLWATRDLPDGARNMIYGQVRDESGKALEGAVVTDGRQTVFSAADGSYTLLDGGEWITV